MRKPETDFESIEFGDRRLTKRLCKAVESMRQNAGKSVLGSGESRSQAKAFYRMLSNDKFDMGLVSETARKGTLNRINEAGGGVVLLIQDTSDINLNGHKKTEGLGYCSEHVKGIKLHSCIAVSPEGVPYGLLAQEYETRKEAKSGLSKTEKVNRPIEDKESHRWIRMVRLAAAAMPHQVRAINICDREGDFFEHYAELAMLDMPFVVRVAHDRKSVDDEKVVGNLRKTPAISRVAINIPRDSRRSRPARQTEMEIAYSYETIPRPARIKDENVAETVAVNFVRITELTPVDGDEPIEWILATNLPLFDKGDVMNVVECYIQRWKIERFHFTLKSGMNAEKIQQRTYEKIKPVLLVYSVIALFIMAVTYLGRETPDMPCDLMFGEDEWKILYRIANKTRTAPERPYSMKEAVFYLAQVGGYKRSPSDGLPGLKSIWSGLSALHLAMSLLDGQG